jgi:hypothetical protein
MGAVLAVGLVGCEAPTQTPNSDANAFTQASQKQGAFVVIEEVAPKQYKIVDEYPAKETRVILKTLDGKEKILSKEELDALIKEEAKRIEEGKSALTNPEINSGMGGMSLGETILASAAGAILGSWIGSKLFNNQNYQQRRKASYKSPSAYSRSVNSFKKARTTKATKRGNYLKKPTTTRRSRGFFGRSGGFRRFGG